MWIKGEGHGFCPEVLGEKAGKNARKYLSLVVFRKKHDVHTGYGLKMSIT